MKRFPILVSSLALFGMGLTEAASAGWNIDGFMFDESGHGMQDRTPPGWYGDPRFVNFYTGYTASDPSGGVLDKPVLIYDNPVGLPSYFDRDIVFLDPDTGQIGDVFRFFGSKLIFYSNDADTNTPPSLADTGFPINLNPAAETLWEAKDVYGVKAACTYNFFDGHNYFRFIGVSEGVVPEPASVMLVALGALALIRRRKCR